LLVFILCLPMLSDAFMLHSRSVVRAVIYTLNLNVHSVKLNLFIFSFFLKLFIHLPQFHLTDKAPVTKDVDESKVMVIWDVMF
jgi:hypothetical protein